MPRIVDNITLHLHDVLLDTLQVAHRADFCVGYFNLRGWKQLDAAVGRWAGGDGQCCRLLVGMQRLPQEDLQALFRLDPNADDIDNQTALRLKKKLVEDFRNQLTYGAPTNEDEAGLRRLAAQIRGRKVVVKLFLAHQLHAKLYLLFRPEPVNPAVGFVGSSNLTLSGLSNQGELNVDVLDHDACAKLARWFEDRWNDPWCLDISDDLIRVIDDSWAREEALPPYPIYVKMAYHLSQEARAGVKEFRIPRDFGNKLFEFQVKAVQIAAHHLNSAAASSSVTWSASARRSWPPPWPASSRMITTSKRSSSARASWSRCGKTTARTTACAAGCFPSAGRARNCRSCAATASSSSTRATTCATARAGPTGPSATTSTRTTANVSCCPPRPTTRPTSTSPASSVSSSPRTRTSASARSNSSANWAKPSSCAATSAASAPWPPSRKAPSPTTGAS